jgi:hypothetical protein
MFRQVAGSISLAVTTAWSTWGFAANTRSPVWISPVGLVRYLPLGLVEDCAAGWLCYSVFLIVCRGHARARA